MEDCTHRTDQIPIDDLQLICVFQGRQISGPPRIRYAWPIDHVCLVRAGRPKGLTRVMTLPSGGVRRIGSGGFPNLTGRVGSGQDVSKPHTGRSVRVGSSGFQISRVGSGRVGSGRVGSGRVGSGQWVLKISRVRVGPTRSGPTREV